MKRAFDNSIRFVLFSNCWVAVCLAVLVLGVAHYYCIADCFRYGAFAFCGTFATYNFHRLVRQRTFQRQTIVTERSAWLNRNRKLLVAATALTMIGGGILLFFLPITLNSLLLLGCAGVIVLFYALPLPLLNKSLRDLGGLKNVWIVCVWIILISIPLLNRGKAIDWQDLLDVALLVYIQIIPFDIRDLSYDAKTMRTLPQLTGKRGAQVMATLLLLLLVAHLASRHPFHWLLPLTGCISLAGIWAKQSNATNNYLELLWEGALLALGLFYAVLPCIPA